MRDQVHFWKYYIFKHKSQQLNTNFLRFRTPRNSQSCTASTNGRTRTITFSQWKRKCRTSIRILAYTTTCFAEAKWIDLWASLIHLWVYNYHKNILHNTKYEMPMKRKSYFDCKLRPYWTHIWWIALPGNDCFTVTTRGHKSHEWF